MHVECALNLTGVCGPYNLVTWYNKKNTDTYIYIGGTIDYIIYYLWWNTASPCMASEPCQHIMKMYGH